MKQENNTDVTIIELQEMDATCEIKDEELKQVTGGGFTFSIPLGGWQCAQQN